MTYVDIVAGSLYFIRLTSCECFVSARKFGICPGCPHLATTGPAHECMPYCYLTQGFQVPNFFVPLDKQSRESGVSVFSPRPRYASLNSSAFSFEMFVALPPPDIYHMDPPPGSFVLRVATSDSEYLSLAPSFPGSFSVPDILLHSPSCPQPQSLHDPHVSRFSIVPFPVPSDYSDPSYCGRSGTSSLSGDIVDVQRHPLSPHSHPHQSSHIPAPLSTNHTPGRRTAWDCACS